MKEETSVSSISSDKFARDANNDYVDRLVRFRTPLFLPDLSEEPETLQPHPPRSGGKTVKTTVTEPGGPRRAARAQKYYRATDPRRNPPKFEKKGEYIQWEDTFDWTLADSHGYTDEYTRKKYQVFRNVSQFVLGLNVILIGRPGQTLPSSQAMLAMR